MAAKTTPLTARIDPETKARAEEILSILGISPSTAISMFYKQIIYHNGIPFEVKLPSPRIPDVGQLTEEELMEELEKGYKDVESGNTISIDEVISELSKKT